MAENRLQSETAWFLRRPSPLAMTGFLREYLAAHFAAPRSLDEVRLFGETGDPLKPTGQLSSPDDGTPGEPIVIESITNWVAKSTDRRPAIVIRREDWTVQRMGINDELHAGPLHPDGTVHYSVLLPGAHTLFCIHRSGASAEMLASEVFRELVQFRSAVRRELNLMTFGVAGVGRLVKLEEPKEHYAVPVTVAYVCQLNWRLTPAAPKLKSVRFSATRP